MDPISGCHSTRTGAVIVRITGCLTQKLAQRLRQGLEAGAIVQGRGCDEREHILYFMGMVNPLCLSQISICMRGRELYFFHDSPLLMVIFLAALITNLRSIFRSRAALELENLALRHQIGVLQRSARRRPKLTPLDQPGRPTVPHTVRDLIRRMCRENPTWGAPRIHGELLKLGIDIGETSVGKYMVRCRKPPSETWRAFLDNHLQQLVSIDFFTVPTLRWSFTRISGVGP